MKRALLLGALLTLSSAATVAAQAAPAAPAGRAGAAERAAAAPDIVGKWEFTVSSPQGDNVMTVTFERADGALAGRGESQMGNFELADVMLAGGDLSFALRIDANGQTFDIPFKGKVTGAAAEGTASLAMGDAPQTMAWKAKKLP